MGATCSHGSIHYSFKFSLCTSKISCTFIPVAHRARLPLVVNATAHSTQPRTVLDYGSVVNADFRLIAVFNLQSCGCTNSKAGVGYNIILFSYVDVITCIVVVHRVAMTLFSRCYLKKRIPLSHTWIDKFSALRHGDVVIIHICVLCAVVCCEMKLM